MMRATLLQAAQDTATSGTGLHLDGPTALKGYLAVMFVLWLLALRGRKKTTFTKQAQEVLDEKYTAGEINKKTYDKYRQDVSLRPKR
jgi:hypothetical protein